MKYFLITISIAAMFLSGVSTSFAQGETNPDTPPAETPRVEQPAGQTGTGSNLPVRTENRIERTGKSPIYTGKFFGAEENERYTLDGVVNTLLPGVARWIAGILAALAVVFLIYAGILFLTAGGEEEKITEAGKTAFYVLVGVILTMFAYVLVYLFLTLFNPS